MPSEMSPSVDETVVQASGDAVGAVSRVDAAVNAVLLAVGKAVAGFVVTTLISAFVSAVGYFILLCFLAIQIVVSVIILILSRNEVSHVPLRAWNIGYLSGCVAALLYPPIWILMDSTLNRRLGTRMRRLLKFLHDCYSANWFIRGFSYVCAAWLILGSIYVSKAFSSRSDAPLLFWLCIVNLVFAFFTHRLCVNMSANHRQFHRPASNVDVSSPPSFRPVSD